MLGTARSKRFSPSSSIFRTEAQATEGPEIFKCRGTRTTTRVTVMNSLYGMKNVPRGGRRNSPEFHAKSSIRNCLSLSVFDVAQSEPLAADWDK